MRIDTRYGFAPEDVKRYDTEALRRAFLVETLFELGQLRLVYSPFDRMIIGGALPQAWPVAIESGETVGAEHLLTHREMGIANIGGAGRVTVDDEAFECGNREIVYVGRGARRLVMESVDPAEPARFYFNSVPAQASFPSRRITRAEAKPIEAGEEARANTRTERLYIHPDVAPSAILLMGITDVAPGSVWNTMPCHRHERRMEVYLYFDLPAQERVFHFMGMPEETRHLVVKNGEAVISPSWSIHMGAGTAGYSIVWGMTGENQDYADMTPVPLAELR